MDEHARQDDAALLPDFAAYGVFNALGGFDEARECREPIWWPPLLAAEKEPFAVVAEDRYDDGGVGSGKCQVGQGGACRAFFTFDGGFGLVFWWADSLASGVHGEGLVSAGTAESVAVVPVEVMSSLGILGGWR